MRDIDREGQRLLALYTSTRQRTEALAAPLSPEDQQLQAFADASPTKWHRAHTTWFFETFVLLPAGIAPVDRRYAFLFNSYYDAVGERHARGKRGLLSRPSAAEIGDYRRTVDERIREWLRAASAEQLSALLPVLELGIAHEEQHQELVLTDILSAFSESPLRPAYRPEAPQTRSGARAPLRFVPYAAGLCEMGARSGSEFVFDNEGPRHKRWLEPFSLADRLVTIAELKAFIDAGGYRTPSLWLSEGYDLVRARASASPLYATVRDGRLETFSLSGPREPADDEPAAHLSFYEADAIARFLGARLPTEAEWEIGALSRAVEGNFVEGGVLHPLPADRDAAATPTNDVRQLFGDVWEWTSSSYSPYPGYRAPPGALGEYNGKFMVSQMVLRGGSCLTPRRHIRATYRNFWHPQTQFQMTGVRLARDVP